MVSVASGRYQCYVVRLQVWGQIYYLHANFDFNGWRRIWEFGGRSDTLEQGVCRVRWVGKIVLFFGWVGGGGGGGGGMPGSHLKQRCMDVGNGHLGSYYPPPTPLTQFWTISGSMDFHSCNE